MLGDEVFDAKQELEAASSRLRYVHDEFLDIALEQFLLAKKRLDLAIRRAKLEANLDAYTVPTYGRYNLSRNSLVG